MILIVTILATTLSIICLSLSMYFVERAYRQGGVLLFYIWMFLASVHTSLLLINIIYLQRIAGYRVLLCQTSIL